MEKNELAQRMNGVDDFIKLLSMVFGRISLAIGTELNENDKKSFVDFLLESRKILKEKYERGG